MEAKAKVKDIAISRERVTLRDVLHEGTCLPCFVFPPPFFSVSLKHQRSSQISIPQKGLNIISRISLKSGTQIQSVCSWLSKNRADCSRYYFFPSLCSWVLLCIIGVAGLVGAEEPEECAVVSFKNHKSLRKTSSKMQTLKRCRRTNRAIKRLSADGNNIKTNED